MKKVYVVEAKRTAVGNYLGTLSNIKAHDLGAHLIKHIMAGNKIPNDAIDEVIIGQVLTAGQGQNPARQAALNAGLDIKTPAYSLNKVCGSGLKAIALGFDSIALGQADLVFAGGQESMSLAPHGALIRQGIKMGNATMVDLMSNDGLVDAFSKYAMGVTAENVAKKYNISRKEQDQFAYESQKRHQRQPKMGTLKTR